MSKRLDSKPMHLAINRENPESPEAVALISELEDYLAPLYPPESQHGYSPQQLADEDVLSSS